MRASVAVLLTLWLASPALAKGDPDVAKICGRRKKCKFVDRQDAGKDAAGRALAVVQVSLGKDDECEHLEHWLVVTAPDGASTHAKLLSLCNDGYGASGVGEDDIKVAPNRLTHEQMGGSAWRWSESTTIQLSPLTVLASSSSGWWNLGTNASEGDWSWEAFKGKSEWWAPDCGPDGEPPPGGDGDTIGEVPDYGYSCVLLPQLPLDPAYTQGGWKTTPLGTCAVRVDSGGKAGYVVHGEAGLPADARFAAVLDARGDLFIEVEDDVMTGPSAKWINDDHLELWLGGAQEGDYQEHCLKPATGKPKQWGIRLADGQVFAAFGKPAATAVRAEVARAPGAPTRLHLTLPKGWQSITVAYSDSDDGKKQKRILATSRLAFGKPRTLGQSKAMTAKEATCQISGGRLDAVVKPSWTPPTE